LYTTLPFSAAHTQKKIITNDVRVCQINGWVLMLINLSQFFGFILFVGASPSGLMYGSKKKLSSKGVNHQ
jgi:hypothetical protein